MANATATPMTMTQKIIAIAVTIIIISTVAIPIIDDSKSVVGSEAQNTGFHYSYGEQIKNMDISINGTAHTYSIDGTVIYSGLTDFNLIIVSDNLFIRLLGGANLVYITCNVSPYAISGAVADIAIVDGSATLTVGTSTYDLGVLPYLYYPDKSGSYGLWTYNEEFHLTRGSKAVFVSYATSATGKTYMEPMSASEYVNGNQTNLFASSMLASSPTGLVTASVNYSVSVVDDSDPFNQVIKLGVVDYTVSTESGSSSRVWAIAPINYKLLDDNDSAMYNLFDVVILMLIMVPLMLAVKMIAFRRN